MTKKTKHFRPKGIFRTFFNYLDLTGNSHLEKIFIRGINGRNQTVETLKSILVEGGLSPKQSNELINYIKKINFKKIDGSKNVSPSHRFYKTKGVRPIFNPKPFQGGSPGLGKKK